MKRQILVETPKRIYGQRSDYGERILFEELGERYREYRRKWIESSRRNLVTEFPLYLQIEHSGKCNLRCPGCIQGIKTLRENYSRNFRYLDIKLYKKILEEAKKHQCPSISFHNNDEPLLLPDLEKRIRLAKSSGFIDIIITTNATLLTKKRAKRLLNSGITKINFSLDGWSKESYERIRRGGNFNTVLKNIEYFVEQRKKHNLKLPITRATCVLSKFTIENMGEFKKFWEKRVDMVEFQNFQVIKGYTEGLKPKGAKIDNNFICNGPWQQLVIRANGDVLPCCSFYGTEMVVGNIKESSIYDIWHNSQMEKIRNELLKNNFKFSSACLKCAETFYTL